MRARAVRSHATNQNRNTAAAPQVSSVSGTLSNRPATLISTVLAVSSTSEATGTGSRCVSRSPRGSTRGTATATSTPSTISTTNASRHTPSWAKSPPIAGPVSVPRPHMAEISAVALAHRCSGSAACRTA
jgi:hypothetical protein